MHDKHLSLSLCFHFVNREEINIYVSIIHLSIFESNEIFQVINNLYHRCDYLVIHIMTRSRLESHEWITDCLYSRYSVSA